MTEYDLLYRVDLHPTVHSILNSLTNAEGF